MMQPSQASFSQMPKDELVQQIRAASFTMRDLALYLDTHPDCENGIGHYQMQAKVLEDALKAYTKRFGAIRMYDIPQTAEGWEAWAQTPWPWEKEA